MLSVVFELGANIANVVYYGKTLIYFNGTIYSKRPVKPKCRVSVTDADACCTCEQGLRLRSLRVDADTNHGSSADHTGSTDANVVHTGSTGC